MAGGAGLKVHRRVRYETIRVTGLPRVEAAVGQASRLICRVAHVVRRVRAIGRIRARVDVFVQRGGRGQTLSELLAVAQIERGEVLKRTVRDVRLRIEAIALEIAI